MRTIASRLRESFRATDFIARIGGDEFVVLLDIDLKLAADVQQNVQDAMERVFKPIAIEGKVTYTGAAVGVTFLQPDDTVASFRPAGRRVYVYRQDERTARGGRLFRTNPGDSSFAGRHGGMGPVRPLLKGKSLRLGDVRKSARAPLT